MDPRLVTSLLSVVAVLLSLAHAYPQEASSKTSPLDDLTKVSAVEDAKTSLIEKIGEQKESPDLPKSDPSTFPGTKLKVRFPSEDSAKEAVALKEEDDDSVRSPRQSPSMRIGHGPHTTTVCIQVRSSHHPDEVVCGPQVEEKKEDAPSARYAHPEYYARATPQYPVRVAQQLPRPVPMGPPPTPIMRMPIYPARRREDEALKPIEQIVPQAPLRVIPAPQHTPVVYRQYYQPIISSSLYPQASQLLRLNCGVHPESAPLINSPFLRSSSSMLTGYYPVGEEVVTLQDGSSAILGPSGLDPLLPRQQSVFSSPLSARMASDVQGYTLNQEPPYAYSTADPWSSAMYPGESGFYPMDFQGRSAGTGVDQQFSNSIGYPSEPSMDDTNRSLLQEQELQQSRLRLKMLQNQLRELHQRSSADEALKDSPATENAHGRETSSVLEVKKESAARTSKRQTRAKEI